MLLAVHYRVMEHVRSLESTQEAIASGNSYASYVLSKLPTCSITRQCTLKHEPIVNQPIIKKIKIIGNISNVKNNANISANAMLMDEQKHYVKNKVSPLIAQHDSWAFFAPRYGSYIQFRNLLLQTIISECQQYDWLYFCHWPRVTPQVT